MKRNKIISVVGNAESLFDKTDGEIIDDAEIIIRFNGGIIKNPKAQGRRTTILAFSLWNKNVKDFGPVKYWQTRNFKERGELRKTLQTKPSNGAVVLEKLKNEYKGYKVNIFGFDWKETPTWYRNIPGAAEDHDYDLEREYCMKMIDKLNWKLY